MTAHTDERLLHRFCDGELTAADAAAFRARLETEPELRRLLQDLQRLRTGFAATGAAFAPPPGFTAGVLAAARRLPSRAELREAELGAGVARLCRRLLVAAAVLFGLGLLWHAGVFGEGRGDSLQAAPGDVQREMDRLDVRIQDGGATAGRRGRGGR